MENYDLYKECGTRIVFCCINHDKLLIQDLVKIKLPYLLLKAWAEFTLYPSSLIIILACQYLTILCVRINPILQCRSSVYVLWNTYIQYEYAEWIWLSNIIFAIYILLFTISNKCFHILSFFVNSSVLVICTCFCILLKQFVKWVINWLIQCFLMTL